MHVAVAFEGVLAKTPSAPIQEGLDMARSMAGFGRLSVFSEAPVSVVERFLAVHRVDPVAQVISGSERPGNAPLLLRQVEEYRANEVRLDLIVIPDPSLVVSLLQLRLAVALFLAPGSTPPKYRPDDEGRRTWEEIASDISERTY